MIQNRRSLYTDVNGMELRDDVMPPFDLVANNGDVHDFIADGVPPHWHSQLASARLCVISSRGLAASLTRV